MTQVTTPPSDLPAIVRCQHCNGGERKIISSLPEGRLRPVFRVVCTCGEGPGQWSVSEASAVRLWNSVYKQ